MKRIIHPRRLAAVGPADGLFYNCFFRQVPGRYARRGYDLASGLGVPQFAPVAQLIPSPGGAVSGARRATSGAG
ncbi:MAG: hypothetical protein ACLP4R_06615 [Solirubrobacteraceae bacterium]